MAPYGVCEVAQSTARSKAQSEAATKSKEVCSKVLSKDKKNMLEQ